MKNERNQYGRKVKEQISSELYKRKKLHNKKKKQIDCLRNLYKRGNVRKGIRKHGVRSSTGKNATKDDKTEWHGYRVCSMVNKIHKYVCAILIWFLWHVRVCACVYSVFVFVCICLSQRKQSHRASKINRKRIKTKTERDRRPKQN